MHVALELTGDLDDAQISVTVRTEKFYATRSFSGSAARAWGEAWAWIRLSKSRTAELLASSDHNHRLSTLPRVG